ncbi:MAG: HD domain-containing protein [Chlamydiota bacterium]
MGTVKKIYDSVHRFIHVDELESLLIDTAPFQRLHYIHQLGVVYLVYPGATHRRFEHSLGVMELATRIYDAITSGNLSEKRSEPIPRFGAERLYWRRVLRLAALCHDLGHLPFSHVAEHRLLGKGGHEAWTQKIIESPLLEPIWDRFSKESIREGIDREVRLDVMKVALGDKKGDRPLTPWEKVVTEIVTGDFFGADRIDYLLRDSRSTGLVYGLFDYHQLIEMVKIVVTPDGNPALGVEENGLESCEALLLARYYMHKRLYQYSSVKSYAYHLARFMETVYYDLGEDLDRYVAMTDNEVLTELSGASKDATHPGHFDAKCLYVRTDRFRAIALSSPLPEDELVVIKGKLGIPDDEIGWEISDDRTTELAMNFPVLKRDGTVDSGANLSEIAVPNRERSWIYVASCFERKLRKELSHVGVSG